MVQFGRKILKRFPNYHTAERFLDGLRYEVDKGTFDPREYQFSNPLGFKNLSEKWLEVKKSEINFRTHQHYTNYIKKAVREWDNKSIKSIQYAELEDFFLSINLSDKSKSNIRSCLHHFWKWVLKRRIIKHDEFPEFPVISFELGWRKTIDKDTQTEIINHIKKISGHVSPKIWLGIKWLSTYISIRPQELLNIREEHISRKEGLIFIPHPKEKKPKVVPLIDEDIEILKSMPLSMPNLYFFRHNPGVSGVAAGQKFGKKLFYKWWKRACSELEIENVDLYGGTRHSSAISLTEFASPEQIKRATMHSTNRAFERYYKVEKPEIKGIYEKTRCNTNVIPKKKSKNS